MRHLYYYTAVACPFEPARAVLDGDPGAWLPPPATSDGDRGWLVRLCADCPPLERLAERTVHVAVDGAARKLGGQTLIRGFRWHAVKHPGWYPHLDGEIELGAIDPTVCQLSLRGTYEPPLGMVGDIADRLVGHRVAEAVVRSTDLRIASRIEAAVHGVTRRSR